MSRPTCAARGDGGVTDMRQPFALLASIRRGLEAVQWLREHNLPVPAEHVELVALIAAELAEVLGDLVPGRNCEPGER